MGEATSWLHTTRQCDDEKRRELPTENDWCAPCVGDWFDSLGEQVDETVVNWCVDGYDTTLDVEIDDSAMLQGPTEILDRAFYLSFVVGVAFGVCDHKGCTTVCRCEGRGRQGPRSFGGIENKGDQHCKDGCIDHARLQSVARSAGVIMQ